MRVAVLGGSGFVGVHVIDALRGRGIDPEAIVRSRLPRQALIQRGIRTTRADIQDPAALTDALAGVEVVVHAAAFYPRTSLDPMGSVLSAVAQIAEVVEACARADVQRLVFVSSTATVAPAAGRPSDERDVWLQSPRIGAYHDAKWIMERVVLDEQRFEVAVACPGACLGPEDKRLGTNGVLVAVARGTMPPYADGIVNTVDVRDVGAGVAALVTHPEPPRRVLLVGDNGRFSGLLAEVADHYGVEPPEPPVSAAEAAALADAAEASGARVSLPREFVDLVVHASPIDAHLAETALGLRWTPRSRTLDDFDAWARRYGLIPSPRGVANA